METQTVKNLSTDTLTVMYDLHTRLFHNVLVDLSDEDAQNRLNTKANHVAWIAGSLVQERFELAKALGVAGMQQTSHELFKDHQGIQNGIPYPSLAEYKKDWDAISPALQKALKNATEEQLTGPDPFGMPGNFNFFDILIFSIDRESYCIGQIGLYRRLLGYEAMKYD